MFLLRSLGRLCLLIAFAAAALDGMRAIATPSDGFHLASMSDHLNTFAPEGLSQAQSFFMAYFPQVFWTRLIEPLLILPMTIVFSALGVLFFLAGYKRPPLEVPF